jgi:hypothetical protein
VKMSKTITWHCLTCTDRPLIEGKVTEHLKSVHGVTEVKGTQTPKAFMDGRGWHSQIYEWDVCGIRLESSVLLTDEGEV